jgi:hypothetical protein
MPAWGIAGKGRALGGGEHAFRPLQTPSPIQVTALRGTAVLLPWRDPMAVGCADWALFAPAFNLDLKQRDCRRRDFPLAPRMREVSRRKRLARDRRPAPVVDCWLAGRGTRLK